MKAYHIEDLNNDGLKDVMLTLGDEDAATNRWTHSFTFYFQRPDGFPPTPDQQIELSKEIILFDFGDVTGDYRKELVYFAKDGIYYSRLNHGFAFPGIRLFEVNSIFKQGDPQNPASWNFVSDLNDDGRDDIMIPQISRLQILTRDPDGGDWLTNDLLLPAEAEPSGHYDPRFSVGSRASATYQMPSIFFEDIDGDQRKDLVAVYKDSLVTITQSPGGLFSNENRYSTFLHLGEIWKGAKINRNRIGEESERNYLMRVTDLNRDGLLDAVAMRVNTEQSFLNPKNQLRIHYGKTNLPDFGRHWVIPKEPDQILEPGGTQLVLDFQDLNQDGKLDLMVPVVNIGLKNLLRMLISKSVEIEVEIYLMNSDDRYPEKPDLEIRMMVRFTYRGGPTSPVYEIADFNRDGYLDILSSQEEKTLIIFQGHESKIIDPAVGARHNIHLPQNGELVRAMHIDDDTACDIVISYSGERVHRPELAQTLKILLNK